MSNAGGLLPSQGATWKHRVWKLRNKNVTKTDQSGVSWKNKPPISEPQRKQVEI